MNLLSSTVSGWLTGFVLLLLVKPVQAQTSQFNTSGDLKSTSQYWSDKKAEQAKEKLNVTTASSTSGATGRIVLFRAFRERSRDKKIIRQQSKDQEAAKEQRLEQEEWKRKAMTVIANYKSGNIAEATDIMQTIQHELPGSGDNVFQRTYNYTCILLLREAGDYEGVISLSKATPEIIDGFPNAFAGCSSSDALLLKSVYTDALHHVNGIQVARIFWKKVTDTYIPFILSSVKEKSELGLCYNIIAMQQFKMGVSEEGKLNILQELALYPAQEKIQFVIYQNIIEFILSVPDKYNHLIDFCQVGLNKIIIKANEKKMDAEFMYALIYNKAALLRAADELDKAESAIKSIKIIPTASQFEYNLLKAKILMGQVNKLNALIMIPTEKEKRRNLYDSYTPAQKQEFDSLNMVGYFDHLEPDYMPMLFDKMKEELAFRDTLERDYLLLPAPGKTELDIYNAETTIQILHSYDQAESGYQILLIGDENNWVYLLRLAQIKILMGDYKTATAVLKKAIADNTIEFELDIALADIYHHYTIEPQKAKETYIIAINKGAFLADSIVSFIKGIPVKNHAYLKQVNEPNLCSYVPLKTPTARIYSYLDVCINYCDGP